jgi:plasmid stability protein
MRRTLVQFDEETYRRLRERAFRQERSVSALVRELVAQGLGGNGARQKHRRIGQFSSVSAGRSRQGNLSPVSENHDAALGAALEK